MLLPLLSIAFGLVITGTVCALLHFPLGPTALVILVVLPLAGVFITADDDLPGGWSNPDGTNPPPWKTAKAWGEILLRLACVFAAFAVGAKWNTPEAVVFWLLCLTTLLVSLGLLKRTTRGTQPGDDC